MTPKEISQLLIPVVTGLAGLLAAHLSQGTIQEIGLVGGIVVPVITAVFNAFQVKIGAGKAVAS